MSANQQEIDERVRATFQAQLETERARLANEAIGRRGDDRSWRWGFRSPLVIAGAGLAVVGLVVAGLVLATGSDGIQQVDTAEVPSDGSGVDAPSLGTTVPGSDEPTPSQNPAPSSSGVERVGDGSFRRENGYVVATVEDEAGQFEVVAIDLATGMESVGFFSASMEAESYWGAELSPDGEAVYLNHHWEDYWFSCDSNLPEIIRLDLLPLVDEANVEPVLVGRGYQPQVSPDGTMLAYLTASECLPDPVDPGNWVISPLDTIVVQDVATGSERRFTVPGIAEAVAARDDFENLRGLVWLGNDRLATSGGDIIDATTMASTGAVLGSLAEAGSSYRVVGYKPSTDEILVEVLTFDEEASGALLQMVSVADGTSVFGPDVAPDGFGRQPFALDSTGEHLLIADGRQLILPDGSIVDLERSLVSVGW